VSGIRCFIAVDVDDVKVCNKIQQIQQQLLSTRAHLKLVEPQNLHFTLHFLGNIEPELISTLETSLNDLEGEPFHLELVGLGCFRPSRPRVIWIGCSTGTDQMIRYQKILGISLRKNRFQVESRKYSPHLTIARVRSGQNRAELMKFVQEQGHVEFGVLPIDSIKLKKSTLTPKGPIYETLVEKKLEQTS
jgi:2'-5' RNA ligase